MQLTPAELAAVIQKATAEEPSLPHRVGKHYQTLRRACSRPLARGARSRTGRIRVNAVARPDMEERLAHALAEVLIDMARRSDGPHL
ncbi:MAG: hypothetical protein ACKVVP_19985 [Chloroflexota bacterium]